MSRLYLAGTNHCDIYGKKRLDNLITIVKPTQICIETSSDEISHYDSRCIDDPNHILDNYEEEISNIKRELEQRLAPDNLNLTDLDITELAILILYRDIGQRTVGFEFKSPLNHPLHKNYQVHLIDLPYKGEYPSKVIMWKNIMQANLPGAWENNWQEQDYINYAKKGFKALIDEHNDKVFSSYYEFNDYERRNIRREIRRSMPGLSDFEKYILDPKREEHMAQRIREIYQSSQGSILVITGLLHVHNILEKLGEIEFVGFPLDMTENPEELQSVMAE